MLWHQYRFSAVQVNIATLLKNSPSLYINIHHSWFRIKSYIYVYFRMYFVDTGVGTCAHAQNVQTNWSKEEASVQCAGHPWFRLSGLIQYISRGRKCGNKGESKKKETKEGIFFDNSNKKIWQKLLTGQFSSLDPPGNLVYISLYIYIKGSRVGLRLHQTFSFLFQPPKFNDLHILYLFNNIPILSFKMKF